MEMKMLSGMIMHKNDYRQHFSLGTSQSAESIFQLLDELVSVGDILNTARKKDWDIDRLVSRFNGANHGFKLKHTVAQFTADVGISATRLRIKLGLSSQGDPTKPYFAPKDKIKIKGEKIGRGIRIDSAANFKDGDPNWAVYKSITNPSDGAITSAAIYVPSTREIYVSDQKKAHHIFLPTHGDEELNIHRLKITPLRIKFAAELGSWHTKERALVKTIFSTMIRESIGGSLHDTGMTELPFAWVSSGARGYAFIGNLKKNKGNVGAFIAEKGGAHIVRVPITTDSEDRDALFALHPDIADQVLEKFYKAIELSEGDVTIGEPSYTSYKPVVGSEISKPLQDATTFTML